MTDLERALRDTLADPPVTVPADKYAIHDIERRIERRRGRQKRFAAGLGVASVIAAAIAVPIATGVHFDSGGNYSGGANSAAKDDRAGAKAAPQQERVPPGPVASAARSLARDYGRPSGPVQWVLTSPQKWAQLRHVDRTSSLSMAQFYVLQFRDFRCTGPRCQTDASGEPAQATAMVATVGRDGKRLQVTFAPAYRLSTLGSVHTFTVR